MENINFIKDSSGKTDYIVLPADFFNPFYPEEFTQQNIVEFFEDLAMNNAMNEAKKTDLLNFDEALKFMEELQ